MSESPTPGSLAFTLAEAGEVTVRVYDARGRLVLTRDAGRQSAGARLVSLVTSSLASGVYLVQVQAGGAVQTTTFTILR